MRNEWAWKDRNNNALRAVSHREFCRTDPTISSFTERAVQEAKIYDGMFMDNTEYPRVDVIPEVVFSNLDTASAAYEETEGGDKRVVLLNFASFTHPGGLFLKGSRAQEESLCHNSNLYNILERFQDSYYNTNKMYCKGNPLYHNKALYTPDVAFMRPPITFFADVITCAAPNLSRFPVDNDVYMSTLQDRMVFLRNILVLNSTRWDTVILGAWGCGVFNNDPHVIMNEFLKSMYPIKEFEGKKIVFAVPGHDDNAEAFKDVARIYHNWYWKG